MLNRSEELSGSPTIALKTQLASIYNMFANYGSSGTPDIPNNLATWISKPSGGTTAGSVIGTDLGSSTLNN